MVVAVAAPLAAAPAAHADAADSSWALGKWLGGSLLLGGVDLDSIAELGGREAVNNGSPTSVVDTGELDLTVLGALNVTVPGGISLGLLSDFLQVGAINEYAEAADNGVSRAASGAVSNAGMVDTTGTGAFPAGATITLDPLLSVAPFNGVLDRLDLELQAITGVAALTDGAGPLATSCADLSDPVNCRDYTIAGGSLNISSPLVANLTDTLVGPGGVATSVDTAINSLTGPNGLLAVALQALTPTVGLLGAGGVTVTIDSDIDGALNAVLDAGLDAPGLHIDLRTGQIIVDLDQLLTSANGTGLADLAPNTQILSGPVLAELADQVGALINTLPGVVTTALTEALDAATLHVDVNICVLSCLVTSVDINVDGTLADVVDGSATATVTARVAGVPLSIPVGTLLGALAAPIESVLYDGALTTATTAVTSAVSGALTALSPVFTALNSIVSLVGNVQEDGSLPGSFREVALRLSVGDVLGTGGVATVDLGRAEVGPNLNAVAAPLTATTLTPDHGPLAGGNTVTVTGSGFVDGTTTVTFNGAPVPVASVSPDGTTLTFAVPPGTVAGPVDVVMSNGPGTDTPPLTYTYDPAAISTPAATTLAPDNGPLVGGTAVTVTGSGFVDGTTTVTFDGASVTPDSVSADGTSLTFTVPAGTEAGPVEVVVSNGSGLDSAPLTYTYNAPSVAGTSPVTAGSSTTATGTGWPADTQVTLQLTDSAGANVGAPVVVTTTAAGELPAGTTVPIPAGTAPQTLTLDAVDANGNTAAAPVEVEALPIPTPTATSLAPDNGPLTGGTAVTVTGSGFVDGTTTVTFDGVSVTPDSVSADGTSLTFTVPAGTVAGPVDVVVSNGSGLDSAPLEYTYNVPSVSALSPVAAGSASVVSGAGWPASASITLQLQNSAGGNVGAPVTVTSNPDGTLPVGTQVVVPSSTPASDLTLSAVDEFGNTATATVSVLAVPPAAPTAASLSPDHGPLAGGNTVTVDGTGFVDGVTTVIVNGVPVTPDTVNPDGTQLTFTVPAGTVPGEVDVVVSNGGPSAAPLPYTYDPPTPTATALAPDNGPLVGGNTVTVTGSGFFDGTTTVTFSGASVPVGSVSADGTSLTFTVPPGTVAGPVEVVVSNGSGLDSAPLEYTYNGPSVSALSPVAAGSPSVVSGAGWPASASITLQLQDSAGANVGAPVTVTSNPDGTLPVGTQVVVPSGTPASDLTLSAVDEFGNTATATVSVLAVPPAAPTAASLSPDHGPLAGGNTVTVDGTGFVDGVTSVIVNGVPVTPDTVNPDGTQLTFTVPAGTVPGEVDVVVSNGGPSAAPLPYTYDPPTVTVPAEVQPGEDVPVDGAGWPPNTEVTVVLTDPSGNPVGTPVVVITTPEGEFPPGTVLPVPPGTTPGDYTVDATDPAGTTATDPIVITAPVTPTAPAAASLAPDNGPLIGGTTVTVTGTGFIPGTTTVTVNGAPVTPTSATATQIVFAAPAGTVAGPVEVVLSNGSGLESAPLTYTYNGPSVSALSPVAAGSPSVVSGAGWPASITLQLQDSAGGNVGAPVTVTSNPDGTLPVGTQVVVPAGTPASDLTLSAVDEFGNSASDTVTVLAVVPALPTASSLSPDHGPLAGGNTVTVDGTGFVDGVTSVIVNGVPVMPDTVSPDGTQLTFTVPAGTVPGEVDVVVSNGGPSAAPLPYTYDPPTVTVPEEVQPGDEIPVEGAGWPPNTEVIVVLVDPDGNPVGDPVLVVTTPEGTFPPGTTVTLPPDYDLPAVIVVAEGPNGYGVGQPIAVTGPAAELNPSASIKYTVVTEGSEVPNQAWGRGFEPGDDVALQLESQNGDETTDLGTFAADANGEVTTTFPVDELEPGWYVVVLNQSREVGSPATATVPFEVRAGGGGGVVTNPPGDGGNNNGGTGNGGTGNGGTGNGGTNNGGNDNGGNDNGGTGGGTTNGGNGGGTTNGGGYYNGGGSGKTSFGVDLASTGVHGLGPVLFAGLTLLVAGLVLGLVPVLRRSRKLKTGVQE